MMSRGKARLARTPAIAPTLEGCSGACTAKVTFFFTSSFTRSADCSGSTSVSCRLPSRSMESTCLPSAAKDTFSTWSFSTASRNVE
jgi:hypothetical protein